MPLLAFLLSHFFYFDTVRLPYATMQRVTVFCVFKKNELVRNIRGILLSFGFNNAFCATKDVFVAQNEKYDT